MLNCPLQPSVNLGASPKAGTKGIHGAGLGSGCWAPEQKHCHLEPSAWPGNGAGKTWEEFPYSPGTCAVRRDGEPEVWERGMGQIPGDFSHHCSESFKGCCNTCVFLFSSGEFGQSLGNNCSFCLGVFESLSYLQQSTWRDVSSGSFFTALGRPS